MNIDQMLAGTEMDKLIAAALGREVCTRQEAIELTAAAHPAGPPWEDWYCAGFYLKEDPGPCTGLDMLPPYSTFEPDALDALEHWEQWLIEKYPGGPCYKVAIRVPKDAYGAWQAASASSLALAAGRAILKVA